MYVLREGEGGRKRKKHQCVVASHTPPTGDLAHNPGMRPNWGPNQQLVCRLMLSPLSHTSQGKYFELYVTINVSAVSESNLYFVKDHSDYTWGKR